MRLSVIVPCFNESATLPNQLMALSQQEWSEPWEVIVADNGSTDASVALARQFQERLPSLRIVDARGSRGAGHARNTGARVAKGAALAFCDADDEVAPGWVAAIGEALQQHDFVASRHELEKLSHPRFLRGRGRPQHDGLQIHRYPPYLPHSGGSGLAIKRELHEAIGGFDESWRFAQDTDYCFRVQLAGTPLHFVPNAVVHVRAPATCWDNYSQAKHWGECNVRLYKKYWRLGMPRMSLKGGIYSWIGLFRTLPQLASGDGSAAWFRRLGLRIGHLQGCLKYRTLAL